MTFRLGSTGAKILLLFNFLLVLAISQAFAQNKVLQFNGVTSNANLALAGNGIRSIELWFKPTQNIDNTLAVTQTLVYRRGSSNINNFGVYIGQSSWAGQQGKIVFSRKVGSTDQRVVSDASSWNAGQWYHVAATIDPSTGMKLYIDGVLQANTNGSTAAVAFDASNAVLVGRWNTTTRYFEGEMDDLRFWETSLTSTQINNRMCKIFNPFIETNLRGIWEFDQPGNGTLFDGSGNGYTGSATFTVKVLENLPCTPPFLASVSYSMQLLSTDYLNIGSSVGDNVRTVECWFKPEITISGSLTTAQALVYRFGSSNTNNFGLYIGQNTFSGQQAKVVFQRNIGATNYHIVSDGNTWNAGQWYHVAGVIDPVTGMKLYIDGVLQTDSDASVSATTTAINNTNIGRWGGANIRFFQGEIDEVRIWDNARTQTEIQMNSCHIDSPTTEANLKAYWDFDGPVANEFANAIDKSANSYTATNYNGYRLDNSVSPKRIDSIDACPGYVWVDGITYNAPNNTAQYAIPNPTGCDTILFLNLTFNAANTGTDVQSACGSYAWIDGNTYTTSNNTATHTLTNVAGCDSVVTLNLTINPSSTGADVQSACNSYTWIDGNTYTASNSTATHTIVGGAASGCDSIVTLNLTINTPTTGVDVQSACNTYTWIDGNTYTASNNTATHTLVGGAANGCDSIVTLNLTINTPTTSVDVQSACNSYTWIDGNLYTASNNTATHTLMSSVGCDSVVTLNLTINTPSATADLQSSCTPFTWIDGNTYSASTNSVTHTLTNAAGCDSVITLNLTINTSTGTDVQSSCNSYTWIDGNTYTASNNTATHTLTNAAGCDSVVTLNLTINTPTTGTDVQSSCNSYTWLDGNTYTASNNTATHTLVGGAANGCDSIVTLNLTINTPTTGIDIQTSCNSYTWIDGNTYTSSNNTATHTLTNAAGCDSVVTLNLTIGTLDNSVSQSGIDLTANQGGVSYQWVDCNNSNAAIAGETNQTFSPTANGSYAVQLTDGTCASTSACFLITTVGIEELTYSFSIVPNPTNGIFTINSTQNVESIEIFNSLGQVVLSDTKNTIFDISHLNPGVYFVKVYGEAHSLVGTTKRLIKQ